ncbi:MAG: hypothetical protein MUE90_14195, partial [Thermoanaerobaculales bacterium]|nr:hypothetical protein [Thermoanaerobaculales bacterium]
MASKLVHHVARSAGVEHQLAVAEEVVGGRQARADAVVVHAGDPAAVDALVLVVAQAGADRQLVGHPPGVVGVGRLGLEVGALRVLEHRAPDDVAAEGHDHGQRIAGGVVVLLHEGRPDVAGRRLPVVRDHDVLEHVDAEHQVMGAGGREEPRALAVVVLVVALLVGAGAAEDVLVEGGAVEQVPHRGPAEALVLASRVLEGEVALGVQGLDEEVVRQHAVVGRRQAGDRQLPRGVDGMRVRGCDGEAVEVVEGAVEVGAHHAVARVEGEGQLALVAVLGLGLGEGHARFRLPGSLELGGGIGLEGAAGGKEPQAVAQDVAAEGRLVGEVVRVL